MGHAIHPVNAATREAKDGASERSKKPSNVNTGNAWTATKSKKMIFARTSISTSFNLKIFLPTLHLKNGSYLLHWLHF